MLDILLSLAALAAAAPAVGITVEESRLLSRIPATLQSSCAPQDPSAMSPRSRAGLVCTLTDQPVVATYERFRSHADASDRYRQALLDGPGLRFDYGVCDGSSPSEGTFTEGKAPAGRLACFTLPSGEARVAWLFPAAAVVGIATRQDGDVLALERFWELAGPLGPPDSDLLAIGGLYPDPFEVSLARILPLSGRNCARSTVRRRRSVLVASLDCRVAGGPMGLAANRFATRALLLRQYDRLLRANGVTADRGRACGIDVPYEGTWTTGRASPGRIACFLFRRKATIAWYHGDLRVLVIVSRTDRNLRALFRWWQRYSALG